ncbi:protein of unknown function DUF490 [Oceanithermus profundus DSM 14977]|uniref:Translocation and assembly module TamB C-terminal domain-containing protein n=1 Tax=Oceanithermus profundus (strain DSM 14977 / NBRC 100410 / VKM B-2274 / 506) TaxID=670487 RepID=E4U7E5_OCEP5|nr:translocation/assembly module TamB domain-containing protein [Oceanithermus profundus]ADR36394.1 protein of unknown function DUF490 [Oceanithermus profundus DSM 14977]
MRFRKRWLFLLLAVLAALPGFPPLIQWGLEQALRDQPFQVEWARVSGYALTGLRFEDVRIDAPGLEARVGELRLGYNLFAALSGKLPLAVELRGGTVRLDPGALPALGGAAGAGGLQPVLGRLVLEDVRLESAAWPRFALPPYRAELSGSLPRFAWRVETDEGALAGELELRSADDWSTTFAGDLALSRFWWRGGQYGRIEGRFGYREGHWIGEAAVRDAGVTLAGFPVREVDGRLRYRDHVITSELQGRSLDGPVSATGVVDVPGRSYRFKAEGRPRLEALLALWKVGLPATGEGPLVIEGSGWEKLHLEGRFQGEGRLFARRIGYDGRFAYADGFTLHAETTGRFLERGWRSVFDWQDGGYVAEVTDDKGSRIELSGEGVRYRGQGRLVWPVPLDGAAQVVFSGEGTRWQVQAESPGVRLPLAEAPLDLSGGLQGAGMEVSGRLGPLALAGRWDDLSLKLDPIPMVVGSLGGSGRWRGGFRAELAYRSPYLNLPLEVVQEGARWRLRADGYGAGLWADGRFQAKLADLPVGVLGGLKLSGAVVWTPEAAWRGNATLKGRYLSLTSELAGETLRFDGVADTPLGEVPLAGVADAAGVRGTLDEARFRIAPGVYRIDGRVRLGEGLRYEGALALEDGRWSGEARVVSPWEEVRLVGRGGVLDSVWRGYLQAEGPLWPEPRIDGVLHPPSIGDVRFAALPVELRGRRLRVGAGRVELQGALPFSLALPWTGYGYEGNLYATGDLRSGSLTLATPWGQATARGPWSALALAGRLELPRLGPVELGGRADLPALTYDVRAGLPQLDGFVGLRRRGRALRWEGALQQGRLRFEGAGPAGRLEARGFASDALGLPGVWNGRLAYDRGWSGDLTFEGPSGRWRAHGFGTLQLEGAGPGYRSSGYLNASKLFARTVLDARYLAGELVVEGPWTALEAVGEGVWRWPGLREQAWTFSASLPRRVWSLGGPIRLQGEGLRYRGSVDWREQIAGRPLRLEGRFQGEGARFEGSFDLGVQGYRIQAALRRDGGWSAQVRAPGGAARLERGRLRVDGWDLAPLGRALGLDLAGRLAGTLDLEGRGGSLAGTLEAAGFRLALLLRPEGANWAFAVYDPVRSAGLRLTTGPDAALTGLGAVQGRLELRPAAAGALDYAAGGVRVGVTADAAGVHLRARDGRWALEGDWNAGVAQLQLEGPVGGALRLDTREGRYRGRLRYATATADALLAFSGQGAKWRGSGYAVVYRGVPQAGPLSAEGDGLDWRVFWAAPLQLELAGSGARLASWRLEGAAGLGDLRRSAGRLHARLRYRDGAFSGAADWTYPGAYLSATGEGDRLRLDGAGFGVRASGTVAADGRLDLSAQGSGRLGRASWALSAAAGGAVLAPRLRAELAVSGEGEARIVSRFDYDGGWAFTARGPGLSVDLAPDRARVAVDGLDLDPFLGLPVRAYAAASGPPGSLVLPLRLVGPWLDLNGSWTPGTGEARLEGRLLEGRLDAGWGREGAVVALDLPRPRVVGEVRYREGRWTGGFDLDLALAEGGVRGRLDAADAGVQLQGYGAYAGTLELGWNPGRLEGRLEGGGAALSADLLQVGEGWVGRLRLESARWGGVLAIGEGSRFRLQGTGPLEPLAGRLSLRPWSLAWAYSGPLPDGLGALDAAGRWPGDAWALGQWRVLGHTFELEGRAAGLALRADGLRALLRASGPEIDLEGFRLGGVSWSGRVRGGWREPELDLRALGLRLSGRLGAAARLDVEGWAQGRVARTDGRWAGRLRVPDGELTAGGEGAWPRLEGAWRGEAVRIAYPELRLGGLELDLARRTASGAAHLDGWTLRGEGERVGLRYPLGGGALTAEVNLADGRARLRPEGIGEGWLGYAPGDAGFSGTLILNQALPGEVIVRGRTRALELSWLHPPSDWLPWSRGRLEARVGLDGAWTARYRGGEARLDAAGDLRRAKLELDTPWGGGEVRYRDGWRGKLRLRQWPVPPLDAGLDLDWTGAAGGAALVGELAGDAGRMSFNLRADAERWLPKVESAAFVIQGMRIERLPKVLNRLPYASGRVDATLGYTRRLWAGRLVSEGLTVAGETYPMEAALYWSDRLKTLELTLGQSRIETRLAEGRLDLHGELVRLPLHFLTGAWAGPPPGTAYWTGAVKASVPLDDPWSGYGVLVGERLDFAGEGKRLRGEAAVRYERRTLYVDALDLSGDGSIRGRGYWGPDDADLTVEIKDTVLTPILGVVPQWRPYRPRAAGSLKLRALGPSAWLEAEGFDFGVAAVDGRFDWLRVEREGERLRVGGAGSLTRPYGARWTVSGQGRADALTLQIDGSAELPLIGMVEGVRGTLKLPGTELDLRTPSARLEGRLRPLVLRLTGELPVAYPEYYLQSGTVRPDLLLTYADGGFTLSGETEVVRAVLSRPEGKREVAFKERRYRYPLRFDRVRFFSKGGLLIQEPLAQGEAEGEVFLGGELADPYLSGEVVGLRGEFLLGRHRFTVDQAWARFSPVAGLYPDIYLRAHTRLRSADREIDLYLESEGHFVRDDGRARLVLEPRLWAEAGGRLLPYTQEELLGLLALGGESTVAEGVASLAIQNLLISQLEYELAKALGLDVFTVQTDVFAGGDVSTTQFTVGKYLSPDLFVSYSLDLGGRQVLGAEYRIDGLRLRVESELGGDLLEPQVRFSMLYAIRPDLDLILKLRTGELRLGVEWRF